MQVAFKNHSDKLLTEKYLEKTQINHSSPKPKNWWWLMVIFGLLAVVIWANQTENSETNADEPTKQTENELIEDDSSLNADLQRFVELYLRKQKNKLNLRQNQEFDSLVAVLFSEELHANDDNFIGDQCVYVITIDGKIFKFGKSLVDGMVQVGKNKLPKRAREQISWLKILFPSSKVEGEIVYRNQKISTKEIKTKETEFIQRFVDSKPKHLPIEERLPTGNQSHLKKIKF